MAQFGRRATQFATVAPGLRKMGRVMRNPRHTYQISTRPFEISPFLLAPVLPGETLKNLTLQARCVTDPIKNRLVGWWMEHYIFYCKLTDLDGRADFQAMMLDPSTDLTAYEPSGSNTWTYCRDDSIDWAQHCLKRVVEEYFRNEGEDWDDFVADATHPVARWNSKSWMDSLVDRTTILDPDDATIVTDTGVTGTAIKVSAVAEYLRNWELLRLNNLTDMSYEDYLATYGIRPEAEKVYRPELIRYMRDWQYPVSAISTSDGSAVSAVTWTISERADKDMFFREPGFIFGVQVCRPKLYSDKQSGHAASAMRTAYSWLPAIMSDDPATSLLEVAAAVGPIQHTTNPYVFDVKDLLLHGDQFLNFTLSATDRNAVGLPNAALTNKEYPDSGMIDELFVGADPANEVDTDGVVSLSIAGTQVETSP